MLSRQEFRMFVRYPLPEDSRTCDGSKKGAIEDGRVKSHSPVVNKANKILRRGTDHNNSRNA